MDAIAEAESNRGSSPLAFFSRRLASLCCVVAARPNARYPPKDFHQIGVQSQLQGGYDPIRRTTARKKTQRSCSHITQTRVGWPSEATKRWLHRRASREKKGAGGCPALGTPPEAERRLRCFAACSGGGRLAGFDMREVQASAPAPRPTWWGLCAGFPIPPAQLYFRSTYMHRFSTDCHPLRLQSTSHPHFFPASIFHRSEPLAESVRIRGGLGPRPSQAKGQRSATVEARG